MANVKVSELTAATTLDEDDLLCSVDTSDSETKKITYGNFLRTVPDGTAAAPSIANTGDADTGILFPSDNTVAISCGGTQRFSVDGSGNVSISGTLTVSGSTTTIESTTLTVDDKNIELGSVATPSDTTADGGGITLKGATDKEIKWVNSTGYWTFNTGIEVGGHLQIDDSNEIRVGTSQDLKIYHDGSNSYIDEAGTGELRIRVADTAGSGFYKYSNNEKLATFQPDGAVTLYHNNNQKLATTSSGVDISGEVRCDTIDLDGSIDIEGNLTVDSGTLHVDAVNNRVGVGTTSPATKLEITGSNNGGGSNNTLRFEDTDGSSVQDQQTGKIEFYTSDASQSGVQAYILGASENSAGAGGIRFGTGTAGSATERLRITSSGNVGLGTTSADKLLHLAGQDTAIIRLENTDTSLTANQIIGGLEFEKQDGSGAGAGVVGGLRMYSEGSVGESAYLTLSTASSSTNDVEALRIDSSGDVTLQGGLDLQDSKKILLGSGDDLEIYHDGSNSFIKDAGTGELKIAGTTRMVNGANTETLALFVPDGQVELYHNNSKKFETKSDGVNIVGELECDSLDVDGVVDITGNVTLHANLDLQDDDQLNIGSGNDFTIRHDGSHSIFENDTGNLYVSNYANDQDIILRSDDGSGGIADYFRCDGSTGEVKLYYYGSQKLNTKSDGVNITGELQCDSLDVDGVVDITGNVTLHANLDLQDGDILRLGTGDDLQLIHNGTNTHIENYTGGLFIDQNQNDNDISLRTDNSTGGLANYVVCDGSTGEVKLYHYGSQKFNTKSDGVDITGELQCDSLDVDGAANITGNLDISTNIRHNTDVNTYFGFPEADTFRVVTGGTERVRITSTGALAIEGASNYGTSGQVLTSNGNDAPTWQDASAAAGTQIVNGTSNVSVLSDANIQFTRGGTLQVQVDGSGLLFQDGKKARFGASADLEIYHDGSNSYIQEKGTGDLIIETTGGNIDLKHGSEYLARFKNDADVELYYNNDKKFETKSDGVLVLGELQSTTLDVNGDADINGQLVSNRIVVRDNGASSPLVAIRADDDAPWAFNVGNDTYSSSDQHGLRIYQATDGTLNFRNSGNSAWEGISFQQQNGNSTNTAIYLDTNRAVSLRYQGSQKFITNSGGVDITGDVVISGGSKTIYTNSGFLQVGTTSSNHLGFITNSTEKFRIAENGALAIGGSTNYGTSGQVLTSNGNAAPSWQDAGGSGYTAYAFATTERNGSITSSQGFASCTRNGTGSYTLTFSTAVGSTAYTVVIGNEDGDNNYLRRSTKASASISYTSRSTGDQSRDMRQGVVVFKQ